MRMRAAPIIALLAFALAAAAPVTTAEAVRAQAFAAAAAVCPQKRLDWIDEYDLTGLIEAWEGAISPTEHNRFFTLRTPLQTRCSGAAGGHRCDNDVDLQAIAGSDQLDSFVAYACKSELACTASQTCRGSVYP